MKYVRKGTLSTIMSRRKKASEISTAPERTYLPEQERWIGLEPEPSPSVFRPISPTRAWWAPQGTR